MKITKISKVARAALEAIRDLFRYLRKLLIGQLDAAVKVSFFNMTLRNANQVLISEAGKENLFLREKAEKALTEIVEVLCADGLGTGLTVKLFIVSFVEQFNNH